MDDLQEMFERVASVHDGHGRWCRRTLDNGIDVLMEFGYNRLSAESGLLRLRQFMKEREYELGFSDISLDDFCLHVFVD